jgi:hypothetical protein
MTDINAVSPDDFKRPSGDDLLVVKGWSAPRIIGEIFGWEHVTQKEMEALRASSELPEDRSRKSIYQELEPLWQQCNEETGDYSPLKPSDAINENLKYLVAIMCTSFDGKEYDALNQQGHLDRSPKEQKRHLDTVKEVLARIQSNDTLKEKADMIRKVASFGEGEMERYYCDEIVKKLDGIGVEELDTLKATCAAKAAQIIADRNAKRAESEDFAKSLPQLEGDEVEIQTKVEMLKTLLDPFPYPDNYELIVQAEIPLMQKDFEPNFFRVELPEGVKETLTQVEAASIEDDLADLRRATSGLLDVLCAGPLTRNLQPLSQKTITFPGSGSMPLTGLMLHIMTGAKINLIDNDPDAVEKSGNLIRKLEEKGILEEGKVQVFGHNAMNVRYETPDRVNMNRVSPDDFIRKPMSEEIHPAYDFQAMSRQEIDGTENAGTLNQFETDIPNKQDINQIPPFVEGYEYYEHWALPDKKHILGQSALGYRTDPATGLTYCHEIKMDEKKGWVKTDDELVVDSDVVFLASLIPNEIKIQIAEKMQETTFAKEALMIRSVKGLSSALAYEPTPTNRLSNLRFPFYGEAVPSIHILDDTSLQTSGKPRAAAYNSPSLAVASSEVLNTTEIFHELPLPLRGSQIDLSDVKNVDEISIKIKGLTATVQRTTEQIKGLQEAYRNDGNAAGVPAAVIKAAVRDQVIEARANVRT